MKIQRYDVEGPETQHECCPGRYVRFEDHEKIVEELAGMLKEMSEAAGELASYVVPLPTEHSSLIYAVTGGIKKSIALLKKHDL